MQKPESYDGSTKSSDFALDCEVYWDAANITDSKKKIQSLTTYCKEITKEWCRGKISEYLKPNATFPSWDDFKKEFIQTFRQIDETEEVVIKLQKFQMGEKIRTVNAYNIRFNSLVQRAEFTDPDTSKEVRRLYL